MSKARQRLKAQRREKFWASRNVSRSGQSHRTCIYCGEIGPHFVPPSLGDRGFYACQGEHAGHSITFEVGRAPFCNTCEVDFGPLTKLTIFGTRTVTT